MASNFLAARHNVRVIIKDLSPNNLAVQDWEIDAHIRSRADEYGNQMMLAEDWVNNAITLVAGTSDYTLPSSVEYASVGALRLDSQGWVLRRRSFDEVEFAREGPTETRGDPDEFYLWEDDTNAVNVRFFPTPHQGDTVDLYRAVLPTSSIADATVLPFSAPMMRVIEKAAAIDIVMGLSKDDLDKIKLNPAVVGPWKESVEQGVKYEKQRIWRMQRVGYVARVETD